MTTPTPDPKSDLPEDEDAIWDAQFETDAADAPGVTGEDARAAYEASQTDEPEDRDKDKKDS
jgi:hypothetical protein